MFTKILLTGSFGVGKSSIFNRFIHQEFTDKYYGTVGVRVNVREVAVNEKPVSLKLWDVAGEVRQDKVPDAYFEDKDIIIYTVDLNREFTFSFVHDDINYIKKKYPNSEIVLIGNKIDLLSASEKSTILKNDHPIRFDWLVSAKTGENIDDLFLSIAKKRLSVV